MDNYDKKRQELVDNSRGHSWKLDDDGLPDVWALDQGHHNGPECLACGYTYCWHCKKEPERECTK